MLTNLSNSISHCFISRAGKIIKLGKFKLFPCWNKHNPGEYIPTWVDIIGKLLYKNQNTAQSIVYRHTNISNSEGLGTLIIDPTKIDQDMIFSGQYGSQNIGTLNDILYTTQLALNQNKDEQSNFINTIEIRIYYDSQYNPSQPNKNLVQAANYIKQYLSGQLTIKVADDKSLKKFFISSAYISDPVTIDKSKDGENRSPSQQAMSAVRDITSVNGSVVSGAPITNTLYGYIIDCVLVRAPKATQK